MYDHLHNAWLHQLRYEWQKINREFLASRLKMPMLVIDKSVARLGYWQESTRLIGIAEKHIWDQPWAEVVETLKHEIAHQYAHQVLGATRETAHGPLFTQACALLGIVPDATAKPTQHLPVEADRILAKVRKLLALAESANPHEAQAAMATANTLLLRYNLELGQSNEPSAYSYLRVGRTAAALPIDWKLVGGILTQYFFVDCIWVSVFVAKMGRSERQLEIIGTATNLELAHYVHDFLHRAADSLWQSAVTGGAIRGKRRDFVTGLMFGFREKLAEERTGNAARGLVWVGDPALQNYCKQRYPSTSSLNATGIRQTEAHAAGRQAGQNLNLHRGMQTTGSSGKLLGK